MTKRETAKQIQMLGRQIYLGDPARRQNGEVFRELCELASTLEEEAGLEEWNGIEAESRTISDGRILDALDEICNHLSHSGQTGSVERLRGLMRLIRQRETEPEVERAEEPAACRRCSRRKQEHEHLWYCQSVSHGNEGPFCKSCLDVIAVERGCIVSERDDRHVPVGMPENPEVKGESVSPPLMLFGVAPPEVQEVAHGSAVLYLPEDAEVFQLVDGRWQPVRERDGLAIDRMSENVAEREASDVSALMGSVREHEPSPDARLVPNPYQKALLLQAEVEHLTAERDAWQHAYDDKDRLLEKVRRSRLAIAAERDALQAEIGKGGHLVRNPNGDGTYSPAMSYPGEPGSPKGTR